MQNKNIKKKIQKTNISKYGGISCLSDKNIIEKGNKTKIKKYKNKNYNNREKSKKTCLEKYGVENPYQNEKIKEKIKKTMFQKYGGFTFKSNELSEKVKKTMLQKYNVEYAQQNILIHKKQQKSASNLKYFKNTNIYYRGTYELDFLEKYYNKIKIKNGPSIHYKLNNKKKIYHSDFIIEELNLIVEIKNSGLLKKFKEQLIQKEKACIKNGHDFILILDKNYKNFDKIIG